MTTANVTCCYRHPNREALVRCTRCERPICPDCMHDASVGFHCPDDARIAHKTQRPQRTSVGGRLRESPPYATAALLAANIAVYLYTGLTSLRGLTDPTSSPLFLSWQMQPYAVYQHDQYYRLFTAAFLHVSPLHIGVNMLALAIVGAPLERLLGRWRFAAVYLFSLFGGAAAVFAFGVPAQPVAGASGAIFGLFAACLVLVRRLGLDVQWLVGIIVLNVVLTFTIVGISKLDHAGGFVAGGLCALAIGGLPRHRNRVPAKYQMGGLAGVAALVAIIIVARAATGTVLL